MSHCRYCILTSEKSPFSELTTTDSEQVECHDVMATLVNILGKRCEYLTSMSFAHNTSYVEMEPLAVKPHANVTIVFATTTQNGILFYTGRDQHLAVELFRGRIRVSYDVGNYPVSTMFRQVYL